LSHHHIVNDITQLNPVRVMAIVAPSSVEDVQEALRRTTGPPRAPVACTSTCAP